ncbi:MAG: 2-hydroxyacid dehydrogenase [Gammaproteobacteria bacterium]|nr:2-hydroxyacid dehydrogenase [Gammaproteobacteria bacterium]
MKGVFLDVGSLDMADLDLSGLEKTGISWQMCDKTDTHEVAARIHGCDVVITNKVVLDAEVLRNAGSLKLICVAATGTNNVDLKASAKLGITVCNVRAYGTPSVVQHVFTLLTALNTSLLEYHQDIIAGRWQRHDQFCFMDHPIRELAGTVIGIVGYGELGRGVAKVAEAFGMKVLVAQRPGTTQSEVGRLALDELLPQVDVLSLHCPLTPETKNLIGKPELALMKDSAILINTARGGIVDEEALADALCHGHLGGAGMDVLLEEPPVHGNVLLSGKIPRLIVTPHIAWASIESRQRLLDQVVDNIDSWKEGSPRRVVA